MDGECGSVVWRMPVAVADRFCADALPFFCSRCAPYQRFSGIIVDVQLFTFRCATTQ